MSSRHDAITQLPNRTQSEHTNWHISDDSYPVQETHEGFIDQQPPQQHFDHLATFNDFNNASFWNYPDNLTTTFDCLDNMPVSMGFPMMSSGQVYNPFTAADFEASLSSLAELPFAHDISYNSSISSPASMSPYLSTRYPANGNLSIPVVRSPSPSVIRPRTPSRGSIPSRSISRRPSPTGSTSSCPDINRYGSLDPTTQTWRCIFPGCSSKATFNRPCDLRKHYNRHSRNFFCRFEGCAQSYEGGFSSKKDRLRHENKHNPGIVCEWEGCGRVFSRLDNMRNHLARIHEKGRSPG